MSHWFQLLFVCTVFGSDFLPGIPDIPSDPPDHEEVGSSLPDVPSAGKAVIEATSEKIESVDLINSLKDLNINLEGSRQYLDQGLVQVETFNNSIQEGLVYARQGVNTFAKFEEHAFNGLKLAGNISKQVEDGIDLGNRALPVIDTHMGNFNDNFAKLLNPLNMSLLIGSAAASGVLGGAGAKLAILGVVKLAKKLKETFTSSKEEDWESFSRSREIYEKLILARGQLIKTLHFLTQFADLRVFTREEISNLLQYTLLQGKEQESLIKTHRAGEQCDEQQLHELANLKVKMKETRNKIKILSQVSEQHPCVDIKRIYQSVISIDGHLEDYRIRVIEGIDIWQQRSEEDYRLKIKSFTKLQEAKFHQKPDDTSEVETTLLIKGLQNEVQACMDTIIPRLKEQYEGNIDWNEVYQELDQEIKNEFGFIKDTEEYSKKSWFDWLFSDERSLEQSFCERKIYNSVIQQDSLKIRKIDFFKNNIEQIKVRAKTFRKQQKEFVRLKNEFSGQLRPDNNLYAKFFKLNTDFFRQILKDQKCQNDQDCDQKTKLRVTPLTPIEWVIDRHCREY